MLWNFSKYSSFILLFLACVYQGLPAVGHGDYDNTSISSVNVSPEDFSLSLILMKRAPSMKVFQEVRFPHMPKVEIVNRVYVKCTYDGVIKPWQQMAMIQKWQPFHVFEIASDHNVHLVNPLELTKVLVEVAQLWE